MIENKQNGFSGMAVIGTIAVIIVVVAFGFIVFSDNKVELKDMGTKEEPKMMEDKKEGIMEKEETPMNTESAMEKAGLYVPYSADKVAMAETGDVVIFFHASWCPSCRGLNSDIEKNLKAIPAGMTILKADYDKEAEMKKKYGVTSQHTLVQVDKDGNLLKKWSGGGTLETILAQLQ